MTQLLERNAAVVARRWPEFCARVEARGGWGPVPEHELVERGARSARLAGVQLASAWDRGAEAALWAARVPPGAARAAAYGVGLGDLPRALLAREGLARLVVTPLALDALRLALALEDQRDWLADPRVELRAPALPALTPFAVAPAGLQLADDDALALRDALAAELDRPHLEARWREREGELRAQLEANRDLVLADRDVAELFGRAPGASVAVVGPGPTLPEGLARLAAHAASGGPIVAVSTALAPVCAAGLRPDAVVMIDARSIDPLGPASRARCADVPLVYAAEVQRATLLAWPGPRYAAYLERPRYDDLRAELPRASLWTEGTVAHSAVDLAVRLGAREVTLYGLDFGYPGGASHAPGTPDFQPATRRERGRTLLDGAGRRLASDLNLITYLRDLERYVARHPEVRFVKVGRAGAALEGVAWS